VIQKLPPAKVVLWKEMKERLGSKNAGAIIGRWCKTYGEGEVFACHFQAEKEIPADYLTWMVGKLKWRLEDQNRRAPQRDYRDIYPEVPW
jgi:hypothetical protein